MTPYRWPKVALGLLFAICCFAALTPAVLAQPSAVAATTSAEPAGPERAPGGRYGEVRVSRPSGPLRGFVVLFSALSGWRDTDQRAADLLAHQGILVVGVDTARYAAALAAIPEACHHLVGDVEGVSHQFERELRSSAYFTPIVAGTGEGGLLAAHMLSVAAANTLAGAVSIDPAWSDPHTTIDASFQPCPADPTILHAPGLPGFWGIGTTTALPDEVQAQVAAERQLGSQIDLRSFPQDTAEGELILALVQTHLGPRAPDEEDVSDLPLVELPAEHPPNMPATNMPATNMLAIVLSGDGGWRDLDQTVAHELQDAGVSVIGIDSLRYFWSRKTPEQTAHDVGRVIQTYARRWHAKSIALIGYSFGADVLPFAYNRLPDAARRKVKMLSLLGFESAADFEIRVISWLGMPPSGAALPVRPEIAKVPPELVQCFYGEDETDTFCPELAKSGAAVIRTGGSHHFGHDYAHLAQVILNGWRRRMTKG
jgi:type IV secretory pathway VirJ component